MIIKFEIPISFLNEKRRIHMYLPDDYLQSKQEYPVLYMFDGHNLFYDEDATYGTAWHLDQEILKNHKEMLVVGIECSHQGNQRLSEYAPYPFTDEEIGSFDGWGKQTMEFIIHELKPYIDHHFPTKTDRNHTWIGGSSCGGLMALYAGFKYSFTFSKALVISPYLVSFQNLMEDLEKTFIHPRTHFYISWGALEGNKRHSFVQETKKCTEIANVLLKKGSFLQMNVKPNGKHCEEDWQKESSFFLNFLTHPVKKD